MDATVQLYAIYLVISVCLTIWVARTLSQNGQVFLDEVFGDDRRLSTAVNKLLVVGFYLVNLGYVTFALRVSRAIPDLRTGIEELSVKVGGVLLVLGILHLINVLVLQRFRRRRAMERQTQPPVAATSWAPAYAGVGAGPGGADPGQAMHDDPSPGTQAASPGGGPSTAPSSPGPQQPPQPPQEGDDRS